MIEELDTVVLLHDVQTAGLVHGDVGAVVHCYENKEAFEVEFVTADGDSIALLTLTDKDIRTMQQKEILHVRDFEAA